MDFFEFYDRKHAVDNKLVALVGRSKAAEITCMQMQISDLDKYGYLQGIEKACAAIRAGADVDDLIWMMGTGREEQFYELVEMHAKKCSQKHLVSNTVFKREK